MHRSDEILVEQTLSGDRDAFSLLVRRYQGMVCGLAYHRLGNFEDAQELAQEAFFNAYRNLHRLEDPKKFSNWLHSITSNTCISWSRKRRLDTIPLDSETGVHEAMDTLPSPEETVLVEEQQDSVRNAMSNLPEPHRLAVTLYYMDGLSVDEVGAFLDIPAGTVKSRLHKARKQLKGDLMAMVEQTFADQKPGDGFAKQFQERIDVVLSESTEILTGLLQKSVPDAEDIQRMKDMAKRFDVKPAQETDLSDLWKRIFDNIVGQDRESAFQQVIELLYQSADLEMWGWQLFAIATLDVLKMAEEDEERKPDDINILMGYIIGQHATDGRFEWRSSDWHCQSWGDLGLFEEIYRKKLKIPRERLEVGTSWSMDKPMSRSEENLYETTIEADDDAITVPAGTFENCLRVSIIISSRRLGKQKKCQHQTLWMAPGVGVVKSVIRTFSRSNRDREVVLKECFIPETNQDYFPLLIGSRWHYEWNDLAFSAPTAEVYRLLCQKGEDFYFSRARYTYGNYADSEVGQMVAAQKKKDQKK